MKDVLDEFLGLGNCFRGSAFGGNILDGVLGIGEFFFVVGIGR